MVMDLANLLFVLKREDARTFDSSVDYKLNNMKETVDIIFSFKTSVELFILNNISFLSCCINEKAKKQKIIDMTNAKIKTELDVLSIIKRTRYLNMIEDKI